MTPTLEVDPRVDSLGRSLFSMQETGPTDFDTLMAAQAGGLAPYLGVTLPAPPRPAARSTASRARLERVPGSTAVHAHGSGIADAAQAVFVLDGDRRVIGIGIPAEDRTFSFVAVALGSRAQHLSVCTVDAQGSTTLVPTVPRPANASAASTPPRAPGRPIRTRARAVGDWPVPGNGILASYLPPPSDEAATVFDSWNGDDRRVGRLRLALLEPSSAEAARTIGFPLLTGPDPNGLAVRLVNRSTDREVARLEALTPFANFWSVWEVEIPRDLSTDQLVLVVDDGADHYGGWIAVATPHWID